MSRQFLIFSCICILSCVIRFILIWTTPLVQEEKEMVALADTISFEKGKVSLPYRDAISTHPLLTAYAVKMGEILAGRSRAAVRLVFWFMGIISTIVMYAMVRRALGAVAGTFAFILTSFNVYHLGQSLMAVDDNGMMTFGLFSLFFFIQAVTQNKPHRLLASGLCMAVGYLFDMKVLLLLPGMGAYLLFRRRDILKNIWCYIALICPLSVLIFDLWWMLSYDNILKAGLWPDVRVFGPSFTALRFYLARSLPALSRVDYRTTISWEIPAMTTLDGVLLLSGVIYALFRFREKKELYLMVMIYISIMAIISLFPHGEFWWADITLWPSIYLTSASLSHFWDKERMYKFAILGICISLFLQGAGFIFEAATLSCPPGRHGAYVDYDMDLMEWYKSKGLMGKARAEALQGLEMCPNEIRIKAFLSNL